MREPGVIKSGVPHCFSSALARELLIAAEMSISEYRQPKGFTFSISSSIYTN